MAGNYNNNQQNNGPKNLYSAESFFKDNGNKVVTLGYNKNSGRCSISTFEKHGDGFDWQNPISIATFGIGQSAEIAKMIPISIKTKQPQCSTTLMKDGQINIHIFPNGAFCDIVFEKITNGQVEPKILIMSIVNNQEMLSVISVLENTAVYVATRLALENNPTTRQATQQGGNYGNQNGGNNYNPQGGNNYGNQNGNQQGGGNRYGNSNNSKPSYYQQGNQQQRTQQPNTGATQQNNNAPVNQPQQNNIIADNDVF